MHDIKDRLRQLARALSREDILTSDEKLLTEELREAIAEQIAAKEAELADLTGYEAELGSLEVAAASYAGGPAGNDSDNNADKE